MATHQEWVNGPALGCKGRIVFAWPDERHPTRWVRACSDPVPMDDLIGRAGSGHQRAALPTFPPFICTKIVLSRSSSLCELCVIWLASVRGIGAMGWLNGGHAPAGAFCPISAVWLELRRSGYRRCKCCCSPSNCPARTELRRVQIAPVVASTSGTRGHPGIITIKKAWWGWGSPIRRASKQPSSATRASPDSLGLIRSCKPPAERGPCGYFCKFPAGSSHRRPERCRAWTSLTRSGNQRRC